MTESRGQDAGGRGRMEKEGFTLNAGGRVPELDGIRGLAILLVLAWHYVVSVANLAPSAWTWAFLPPLRLTWSGVDLFFVLSGYLIGGILLDARDSPKYYSTFYGRRCFRILPLYVSFLLLFFMARVLVFHRFQSVDVLFTPHLPLWSYLVFLQNIFMSVRGTFGPGALAVTWSLAVEEQFYGILPFLVRRGGSRGVIWVAVFAIVLAPAFRVATYFMGSRVLGPYTLLPCRADALGWGIVIAVSLRNRVALQWLVSRRRGITFAFMTLGGGLAALSHYPKGAMMVAGNSVLAAFYASLLLLILVTPGSVLKSIFQNGLLTTLGTISYGVYLLHQPVNYLFHALIRGSGPGVDNPIQIGVTGLSLLVAITISWLSWKLFESPIVRYAQARFRYFSRERVMDVAISSSSLRGSR